MVKTMTEEKQQNFERKKKQYRAVYRKAVPYRKVKGRKQEEPE
jgi:hypothetical protein